MKSKLPLRLGLAATLIAPCVVIAVAQAGVAPAAVPPAATSTLIVNADQPFRSVTHVASGGLYGLADDETPSDQYVIPLHPNTFVQPPPNGHQLPNGETATGGDSLVVAAKAARAGAGVIVRMPDWYSNFPYKWVSKDNWLSAVDSQVNAVLQAKANGVKNIEAYEIWNEPDGTWNTNAAGPFDAAWAYTYQEIRRLDPTTPIDGPSRSSWNLSYFQTFLTDAIATNTVPDIISWHELSTPANIAADVSAYRNLEASLGLSPRPIVIEEYATTSQVGVPGALVQYVAKFERAGVQSAEMAFWNNYGSMSDVLTGTGGVPNGGWWLMKWYGDMTGQMVSTTPPSQAVNTIDGAASINPDGNLVSVIFGGQTGSVAVNVNGLTSLPAFGTDATRAHVRLQVVSSGGRTVPVAAPQTIFDGDLPIVNGTLAVPVAAALNSNGYHLLITPAGTPAPGINGPYTIQDSSQRNLSVNGFSFDTQASPTCACQWPGRTIVDKAPDGTQNQIWNLVDQGTGYYRLINQNDGMVLGVDSNGAVKQQRPPTSVGAVDNATDYQLWSIQLPNGSTSPDKFGYKLINKATGLALTNNGDNPVTLEASAGNSVKQRWFLTPTPEVSTGRYYTLVNLNSLLPLSTLNAGTTTGTQIVQANPATGGQQNWQFVPTGTGYYNIVNQASGLLLGVSNGGTASNANEVLQPTSDQIDTLWQVIPNGAGGYKIANVNSGLDLGVLSQGTTDGTPTVQAADNNGFDKLWLLEAPTS